MSNTQETARQMFQRADTEEGHIAIIAHRSRDIPALQAQGWAFSVDEAANAAATTQPAGSSKKGK